MSIDINQELDNIAVNISEKVWFDTIQEKIV
jgi:hypothetical protein